MLSLLLSCDTWKSMAERLLNTRDVATYLQVSEQQVYRLIRDKALPSTWVKGRWVFSQHLVVQWVHGHVQRGSPASFDRLGKDTANGIQGDAP